MGTGAKERRDGRTGNTGGGFTLTLFNSPPEKRLDWWNPGEPGTPVQQRGRESGRDQGGGETTGGPGDTNQQDGVSTGWGEHVQRPTYNVQRPTDKSPPNSSEKTDRRTDGRTGAGNREEEEDPVREEEVRRRPTTSETAENGADPYSSRGEVTGQVERVPYMNNRAYETDGEMGCLGRWEVCLLEGEGGGRTAAFAMK